MFAWIQDRRSITTLFDPLIQQVRRAVSGGTRIYPCVRQFDEEDCGAACMATVAASYGAHYALSHVRDVVGTTGNGTTLLGLRRGAESLGFRAQAAKADPQLIDQLDQVPLPLICHWHGNHWVVLHASKGDLLVVADPAIGLVELDHQTFLKGWTDCVVLVLEPDPARFNRSEHAPQTGLHVFRQFLTPFRPLLTQAIALNSVIGLLGLSMPLLMQILTDDVLIRGDSNLLASLSLALMLLFVLRGLLSFLQGHMVGYFAQKLQLQMTMHYGHRLLALPLRYFENRRSGEVVSRISDIQHLNSLMTDVVLALPSQLCIALVSLLFMWTYNAWLTLAALACYLVVIVANLVFLPAQAQLARNLLAKGADNQGHLVELFRGMSVLKCSDATSQAWQEYQRNIGKLTHLSWLSLRLDLKESTLTTLLGSLSGLALLWYGSSFVIQQQLSIGQLLAFNGMGANVLAFLTGIAAVSQEILRADVVLKRMSEVLSEPPEQQIHAGIHSVELPNDADIVCDKISFHHPGRRELLDRFSLHIPGGITTAIIGESGCGKSTLMRLVAGIDQPQSGSILYGPYSGRDLDINNLRKQVVLVPQESVLFNRSICDNFRFAHPDATFDQIVEACRISLADEFIRDLPEGYQTVVGEFGANLSGGQRQRLAIARALLTRPPILILDESTSALDPVLENRLLDQLLSLRQGQTTLFISHRPSMILRADWIVYLEAGQVKVQNHPAQLRTNRHVSPFLVPS